MIPYWILLIVWATGALQYQRSPTRTGGSAGFWLAIACTTLFVGLRWHVGGDWASYQNQFNYIRIMSLSQALVYTDPAYGLLSWTVAQLGLGVVTVNLVCAAIFMGGVGALASKQINPWLAVAIAVPYFILVVGMGYTRQATAIGFVLLGLSFAERRGFVPVVLCVAVGALFHKSAVVTLPLFAVSLLRRNFLVLILAFALSAVLYAWVLAGAADRLVSSYVNSEYQSNGAPLRIAMNLLAALTFFAFRKRMGFSKVYDSYWFAAAIVSCLGVLGLISFSSSVGIDRVSLFLIPLQIAVYSRIPYAISSSRGSNSGFIFAPLLYSGAVLIVFLSFGNNSAYWIPYQFSPLIAGLN